MQKTIVFYSTENFISQMAYWICESQDWSFFHYQSLDNIEQLKDLSADCILFYSPNYNKNQLDSFIPSEFPNVYFIGDDLDSDIKIPVSLTQLTTFLQKILWGNTSLEQITEKTENTNPST